MDQNRVKTITTKSASKKNRKEEEGAKAKKMKTMLHSFQITKNIHKSGTKINLRQARLVVCLLDIGQNNLVNRSYTKHKNNNNLNKN